MRTTVRLSSALLRRAKKKAADEGRTLASVLEEGLKLILAEAKPHDEGACSCQSRRQQVELCRASMSTAHAIFNTLDELNSAAAPKIPVTELQHSLR
jgi:hypothetical protein